jgi:hypothetical protein
MGVLCRATCSIALLCLVVSNSCKMGASVRRCPTSYVALYHMHVCGYNWKVPGWRQELDCEGISKAYKHLWVHSASFFTTGLKSAQFCIQVWCASVDILWDMSYQSGTVMPQSERHDTSGNCNWWDISSGLWARTQTAVLQTESSTFTIKSQGSTKSVAHKTDDYFGLWHLRCSYVSSSSTGWNCEYGSTSTLWVQFPELIENAIILHNNATAYLADTFKNVVWLYNNHPVFLMSAMGLWSNSKTETVIAWRMTANRENVLRVAFQKWHTLFLHVGLMVLAIFLSLVTNCIQPQGVLWRLL